MIDKIRDDTDVEDEFYLFFQFFVLGETSLEISGGQLIDFSDLPQYNKSQLPPLESGFLAVLKISFDPSDAVTRPYY